MTKRIFALTIAILMIAAALAGCKGSGGDTGVTESGNNNVSYQDSGAKGRYVEQDVELPLPEGANQQSVIGMAVIEGGVEYFTSVYANEKAGYFRHTITDDGNVTTKSEAWLDDNGTENSNGFSVTRSGDKLFACENNPVSGAPRIIISSDNGESAAELKGSGLAAVGMINRIGVLSDGRILVSEDGGSAIYMLDESGGLIEEIECNAEMPAGFAAAGSKVAFLSPDGGGICVYDMDGGDSVDWDYDMPGDAISAIAMAFADDGSLYLADSTGLYSHAPDGTLWENIMDGSSCALGLPGFSINAMTVASGEWNTPIVTGFSSESSVYRYVFDEEASRTISAELNIFSLEENDTIRRAVVEFSRSHTDVTVNYTAPLQNSSGKAGAINNESGGAGTAQDYIKALNTELLAGSGPDIIILDGLPMDSYIEKDVLMDITSVLDSAEPILPNVRNAYTPDGKMYGVPLGVKIPVAISDGGTDIFDSLDRLAAQTDPPPLSPMAFSYELLAKWLLKYYGADLYTGNPAAAEAFLTSAKAISGSMGVTDNLGEGWDNDNIAELTQEQMRRDMLINNEAPQYYALFNGLARAAVFEADSVSNCMIAAAVMDERGMTAGGAGGKITATGLAGINKASANQEEAAEFIKTALSAKVQEANKFSSGFPVNAAALDTVMAYVDAEVAAGVDISSTDSIQAGWPSDAARMRLKEIITGASVPLERDVTLEEMLLPEIIAVLDGSSTPEAGVGKIGNLLNTYLSE